MMSLIYNDKIIIHTKWFIFNVTVTNFIIHCLILVIYETVYVISIKTQSSKAYFIKSLDPPHEAADHHK